MSKQRVLKFFFRGRQALEGDWRWQFANRITNPEELLRILPRNDVHPLALERLSIQATPPFAVTPYYLSLAESLSYTDPIIAQCLPHYEELVDGKNRRRGTSIH